MSNNHFCNESFLDRWHLIGFDEENHVLVERGNVMTLKELQDLQECIDSSIKQIKQNDIASMWRKSHAKNHKER